MSLRLERYLDSVEAPELKPEFAEILARPLAILDQHSHELVKEWTNLYLKVLGRRAFFPPEKIRTTFTEMLELFLYSLRRADLESYFDALKEKGALFSEWGVPFEEVILCLQLFEEAYLSLLIRRSPADWNAVLPAFEEFNHASTAVFAVSYFKSVRSSWQKNMDLQSEETEEIKRKFKSLQEDWIRSTQENLASMDTLLSRINEKLKKKSLELRQIYRLSELLSREGDLTTVLRVAYRHLMRWLPGDSDILFGIFDESESRVILHEVDSRSPDPSGSATLQSEEYFVSQFSTEFQSVLLDENSDPFRTALAPELPEYLTRHMRMAGKSEYLFLPLKKFKSSVGFILIGTRTPELFAKTRRLWVRIARAVGNAVFSCLYYQRFKKHSLFISTLEDLDNHVRGRVGLEAAIDHCLGSLIELTGVERASLMLLDDTSRTLMTYAAKGARVYPISGLTLRWGEGVAGSSVKDSRIIFISRLRSPLAQDAWWKQLLPQNNSRTQPRVNVKSLCCVPLRWKNEPIGVINLSTLNYHVRFDSSDMNRIQTYADRLGEALVALSLDSQSSERSADFVSA